MEHAELRLTCRECGHREASHGERLFMAKVRMLNHLNRAHPATTEAFRRVVAEEPLLVT